MNQLNFSLLVFFLSAVSVHNITPSNACHNHERAALLTFKSQLTDPSNRLSSWQPARSCCTWNGIQCSDSLHVVSLDLRNPNPTTFDITMNSDVVPTSSSNSSALNGTIPSSLFHLSRLTYLDLSFNNFMFSRIPPGISNLSQLSYLNLSNAMFSDSIRTTQFSNMTNLKRLDLSCSSPVADFSSVTYNFSSTLSVGVGVSYAYLTAGYLSSPNLDWLQGMINLRALVLTGVDLSQASSTSLQWARPISGLYSLRSLLLSSCKLSGEIPVNELLNVTQLSFLYMDFNSFHSRIPPQFANMTSLEVLDLTCSDLQGGVPHLPQLDQLYVGNSNLSIDLNSMFSLPWPRLQVLDIKSTHVVTHIPPSIANATSSLVSFTASNCLLQGSIPPRLTNLSDLETLKLDFNKLTGQLPSSFFTMRNLKLLSVMGNLLEGSIPASVCNMSSLQQLGLSSNSLTGKLPDCIGGLPNLRILMVSLNFMTGTIRSLTSFFDSSSLYMLHIGNNKFTVKFENNKTIRTQNFKPRFLDLSSSNIKGGIPNFLSNMTQLSYLSMANNSLSGTIPSWLFNLPNLVYLDLSLNKLQGLLPPIIRMSSSFMPTTLNLAENFLQGAIPLLENMESINLSGNNFTGKIPPQLQLGKIRYLSFARNQLSGQIPQSFCLRTNNLMLLDLSNNTLSGAMPNSLGNCSHLTVLKLGVNNFTGEVPGVLANAKDLSYLDVADNHFQGSFPSFISEFKRLVVLKLGHNQFSGRIPSFIGDLHDIRILMMESNIFSETIPADINNLQKLQVMDMSNNRLTGGIPETLDGLQILTSRPQDGDLLGYVVSAMYMGVELSMVYKGFMHEFDVVRTYHSGIDLSLNHMTGNIPPGIARLKGLSMLNLSHNRFSGNIPATIGDMSGLESIDLSFNNLSGDIPNSINLLDALGTLNLSYNNLSGEIPSGRKMDTLYGDGSGFTGNKYLCGSTGAIINCSSTTGIPKETGDGDDDGDEQQDWLLYVLVTVGYGVGLWGYFGFVVFMKVQWKEWYWKTVDKIASRTITYITGRDRT